MVTPEPESRLEQLTARLDGVKAKKKQADEEEKELTSAIKGELQRMYPGVTTVVLTSPYLQSPMVMSRRLSWQLDTKALKAQFPQVYASFARQVPSWRLEALGS